MATMRPPFKRFQRLLEHENTNATAFMRSLTPRQGSQFYAALRANGLPMPPGDHVYALPEQGAWLAEEERMANATHDTPRLDAIIRRTVRQLQRAWSTAQNGSQWRN